MTEHTNLYVPENREERETKGRKWKYVPKDGEDSDE